MVESEGTDHVGRLRHANCDLLRGVFHGSFAAADSAEYETKPSSLRFKDWFGTLSLSLFFTFLCVGDTAVV